MTARLFIIFILSLVMMGCRSLPYGNYASGLDEQGQQAIAKDVVEQFKTLYPPAKTEFTLKQSVSDEFGKTLVSVMREQGYAILESNKKDKSVPSGLVLNYLIEQPKETDFYYVRLTVGTHIISRPYMINNGVIVPAGYWMYRE